jgi:hypothetical protein
MKHSCQDSIHEVIYVLTDVVVAIDTRLLEEVRDLGIIKIDSRGA